MVDQVSLGKNGNKGKVDLTRIKAGAQKEELVKNDKKLAPLFDLIDKNKDGVLDREELDELQDTIVELAGDDGVLKKKEVKNFNGQKLSRKERKALLELLNRLDGVTSENITKVESKNVNDQLTEVVTFDDGHKEVFDDKGKKLQNIVVDGASEKTYDCTGEKEQLRQTVENKNIPGKEKTTEFEYDEKGNVNAQNVTTETKAGKVTGRYEIDSETGLLLPKTSIQNKGSENEVVTNFEVLPGGLNIVSTTKTSDGELKVLYEITDKKNPDGTPVLNPKSEILTTKDGFKETKYNDDGTIEQTQKEGNIFRKETHEQDGTIRIVIENGEQYTRKTINPDNSWEFTTNMNESGDVIYEKYNEKDELTFRQVTDKNNNITQTIVEDDKITTKKWDKDSNYTETVRDRKTNEIISSNSALGAKARAEKKKKEYINNFGHMGLDPKSVDKYLNGNNRINVQMQLPRGKAKEKELNGFKYTEYENYETRFSYNSEGEIDGVNYIPKYKQSAGRIIGDVKGAPNTVIVAAKDVNTGKMMVYYVDKKDGKIRTPKNVRGEIAFNTAKPEDKIQADIIDNAGNGNIETQDYSQNLVFLKDANGKFVMRNGYRVAVDKYGNESLIADNSTLTAKDLVSQHTLTFNRDGDKVEVTVQYGQDGKPIRGTRNSVQVKDANGKILYITNEEYNLHKARQAQYNNAGNGKYIAVRTGKEGSIGAQVSEKFMTADAIASNPKLAADVTKMALEGMQDELKQAREDYEKYRNGDLQSWDHRVIDGLSGWFGSENYSGTVHEKFDKMDAQLNKLLSTDDPEEFKKLYKEFSGGKDLDPKAVARFYAYASETSRKNAFGDANAQVIANDYIDSQYSTVGRVKTLTVTGVGIAAAYSSGGLLAPALVAAGTSLAWDTGHLGSTGREVDWSLLHEDENGNIRMGELGEVTWEAMKEGALFYGAGKGYQLIEKSFGKELAANFMKKSGEKMLAQTEKRIANLGIKEPEKELARLTAKQQANEALTKAEQKTFELLTTRQTIINAANEPTINNLNALVRNGIVKNEFFEQSVKDISKEMIPKTVAFDTANGVAIDTADMAVRATFSDEEFRMPTAENVLTYAGMSLAFQYGPRLLKTAFQRKKTQTQPTTPEFIYKNDAGKATFKHQAAKDADPVIAPNSSVYVKTQKGIYNINAKTDELVATSSDGKKLAGAHNELDALSNRGARRSNQRKIDEKAETLTPEERAKYDESVQQHHKEQSEHTFERHNELSQADYRTIVNSIKDAKTPNDLISLRRGLKQKEYTHGGVTAEYKALEEKIDNKLTNMIRNAGADDLEKIGKQLAEMKSQVVNDARLAKSLEKLDAEIAQRKAFLKNQHSSITSILQNGKGFADNAELNKVVDYIKSLDSKTALNEIDVLARKKSMTGAQKKQLDSAIAEKKKEFESVELEKQHHSRQVSSQMQTAKLTEQNLKQFENLNYQEMYNQLRDRGIKVKTQRPDGSKQGSLTFEDGGKQYTFSFDKNGNFISRGNDVAGVEVFLKAQKEIS